VSSLKIYVGSPDGGPFTELLRKNIIERVLRTVESFTVQDAEGYYQGRRVATLIISVWDVRKREASTLAADLATLAKQKEVALEVTPTTILHLKGNNDEN
tara:strand:+ start:195 stop:494 length:300 start_codon:yes stop_codon:yes gene_type:complete